MQPTVIFRDFEERDIDFIYKCKNDEELNSLIVGHYHPFTYEEATNWVHGCMGEHGTYKFWAIATNDEEKRIVGWVSLSEIDYENKSVCSHGVVIGDKNYQDGLAWVDCGLFLYSYVFETLQFNRIYGSYIEDQVASRCMAKAMFETIEGTARQAVFKNNKYHNVIYSSLLKEEYLNHKKQGDYEFRKIISRLIRAKQEYNKRMAVMNNE